MRRILKSVALRLLALGLVATALLGLTVTAQALWNKHLETETAIEDSRILLGRLEQAVAEARPHEGAEQLSNDAADVMMVEESEGLAIAALQARLSDLASASGLRIESSSGLPARDQGALRLIGLRIEVSGSDETVGQVLHGIETARPLLLIEGARIRGRSGESEPRVDAILDVYAAVAPKQAAVP